ncbi:MULTISPECIES: translation elongation factor Ts [Alysiella]|uniref:Elongation factor Ts n=2 Tax=Alysiella TaxID=194195 RepID=A0A376BRS6_9NEIS|nr:MULTISPECIES: translation elongation factor Ts [Alysiella]MDO4433184.1 translation elongation factor Ts [Alysiella sp.]QMT31648.1 elongation factor Ts [Alysiella filiformis]UBQ55341.1 translation elongation factor Ts [Alysiella filiformis DSM 16848]UOP08190.1 translation elongation factor Ts [Alysiella crassa]SOD69338.1 elongation factor Ts [Alysiella filiformis DSM 16848]
MAEITAKMVADLRAATGLGMMECKKALVEAEGNFEKAEEILRIKSGAKAGKLAGRTAAEGVLAYAIEGKVGALVEVNCETDFVAKDAGFVEFANFVAKTAVAKKPATVEELAALVEDERKAVIAKLGENMSVRRFQVIETSGELVAYIHGALATEGVLVEYTGSEDVARKIGMHIVAAKPQCVREDQVDAETVEKERHIYTQQAIESGKPAEIAAKMVEGRIKKFLAEVSLNGQAFVMNPDQTVAQYAKENGTEILSFARYKVGDGIEKAVVDYAAEVAAAAKV